MSFWEMVIVNKRVLIEILQNEWLVMALPLSPRVDRETVEWCSLHLTHRFPPFYCTRLYYKHVIQSCTLSNRLQLPESARS
jgi:hypothetical protein